MGLAVAAVLIAGAPANAQVTSGALYDFRAETNDEAPNGWQNLGTLGGRIGVDGTMPTLTTGDSSLETGAYYDVQAADGAFEGLEEGDDLFSDDLLSNDGFTYEMMARRTGAGIDDSSEHGLSAIAEQSDGGNTELFVTFRWDDDTDDIELDIMEAGNAIEFPLNEWIHFVAVVDVSGDTGTLYVNGGAGQTLSMAGSIAAGEEVNAVTIFKIRGSESSDRRFDGDISAVRLYDRLLSPAEALANYEAAGVSSEAEPEPEADPTNQGPTSVPVGMPLGGVAGLALLIIAGASGGAMAIRRRR
jgi:hypothetical protein